MNIPSGRTLASMFYTILTAAALTFASCDDNTDTLGLDMMPSTDITVKSFKTYDVSTESYAVGNVLARTSMSYLGRFTDPETGTVVKSDFLAQFHCSETFAFPEKVKDNEITKVTLQMRALNFVGDSLAPFKLSIYPLNKVLDPTKEYYTDLNPEEFYDNTAKPLTTKWFSISDRTVADETRWGSSSPLIRINLPTEIGQAIYDGYRENPSHFSNTESWLNSGLPCSKGFYFKLESGDGAMAYIDVAQMNLHFRYYDDILKTDTTGVCQFASTEEVIQATRFENYNIEKLMDKKDCTYIKSPAGIFTLATLPTDEISAEDTISSAKLTFTRYNDNVQSDFKLDIPQTVLLVRLDDYKRGFFEKYKVANEETSYLAKFNASNNSYVFGNIARLLSEIRKEKQNGTATENADKVLLIPVQTTYDSSNKLVKLNHDFSMSTAKLVGGTDKIKLEVIYSQYATPAF